MGVNQRFSIILDPDGEGGFSARVPALPGIEGHGADARSALAEAEAAIERKLGARRDSAEPLPNAQPRPASLFGAMKGSVEILCDLTEPMGEIWNDELGILLNE